MSDQSSSAAPLESSAIDIAQRVAEHLGGSTTWKASVREAFDDHGRRYAELTRATDGAQLGVTVGGYRSEGRVSFRAHWPKYRDGQGYTPRNYLDITCSTNRSPQALARDIERRLLKDYEPAYATALAEVSASDAAATDAWAAAERIANTVGASLPSASNRPRNGASIHLHGGPDRVYRLEVHPGYAERGVTVRFEVHDVDEATALHLLGAIGALPQST